MWPIISFYVATEKDADDREDEEASSDVQENDFQAKGGENADEIMETAAEDQAGKGGDEASENKAGIVGKETVEEKEEGELNDEEQEVKIEKPKPVSKHSTWAGVLLHIFGISWKLLTLHKVTGNLFVS